MEYWLITDKDSLESYVYNLLKKIKLESGLKRYNTNNLSFGSGELLSLLSRDILESEKIIFIIDLNLSFGKSIRNSNLTGLEIAIALRTANKLRTYDPIIIVSFLRESKILENTKISFDAYGFDFFRLPLSAKDLEDYLSENHFPNNKGTFLIKKQEQFNKLPQCFLIGMIDDHHKEIEAQLGAALKNESDYYFFFSFPYNLRKSYEENEPDIVQWIKSDTVIDLLLLDINFDDNEHLEEVSRGGSKVLSILESINYQIPVSMFSVSKNIDLIKSITLNYNQLISDYIAVESRTNTHSKRDIINVRDVTDSIKIALKKNGAVKNRIGILVTHGTDTMAWSLNLIQYSLKRLTCNIVVTGSQVPLKSEFSPSDAPANIISALHFLNQAVPPKVGVSFNMGKKFLTNNLKKVRIWNEDAFDGNVEAQYNWQEIDSDFKMLFFNNCLNELYLLTTGGTIAMNKTKDNTTGSPSTEIMTRFFKSSTAKYRDTDYCRNPFFDKITSLEVDNIDSSEMNPEVYTKMLGVLKDLNSRQSFASEVDDKFRWDVYPILCTPFLKNEDYSVFEKFQKPDKPVVFVLLGYGAGNLPFNPQKGYSPMDFARKMVEKNIVILTSHVMLETPDLDYDVSVKFINEGVLFSGNMTLAEIMIKSAYLLGHYVDSDGLSYLKSSIMSGVKFRSKTSRIRYLNCIEKLCDDKKYILPEKNFFKLLPYNEAKQEILKLV